MVVTAQSPDQAGTVEGTPDIAVPGMHLTVSRRIVSFIFVRFGALEKLASLRLLRDSLQ